jgi:hypothetical protein
MFTETLDRSFWLMATYNGRRCTPPRQRARYARGQTLVGLLNYYARGVKTRGVSAGTGHYALKLRQMGLAREHQPRRCHESRLSFGGDRFYAHDRVQSTEGLMGFERALPTWDVFVSYASEDGPGFVRPLVTELERIGIRVWFDDEQLTPGRSVSGVIDLGIARSRRGLVVFSPHYLSKYYTFEYELRGLLAKERHGESVIVPVLLNTTAQLVQERSPTLSERKAILANGSDPSTVAEAVAELVDPVTYRKYRVREFLRRAIADSLGPVRHVTASGRFAMREYDLILAHGRDASEPPIDVSLFFAGWDGTTFDVAWWNEFWAEMFTGGETRMWSLPHGVVVVISEQRLWCAPSAFPGVGGTHPLNIHFQPDNQWPNIVTVDIRDLIGYLSWRVIFVEAGANPGRDDVLRWLPQVHRSIVGGNDFLDATAW